MSFDLRIRRNALQSIIETLDEDGLIAVDQFLRLRQINSELNRQNAATSKLCDEARDLSDAVRAFAGGRPAPAKRT